jgi:hypothetical protein
MRRRLLLHGSVTLAGCGLLLIGYFAGHSRSEPRPEIRAGADNPSPPAAIGTPPPSSPLPPLSRPYGWKAVRGERLDYRLEFDSTLHLAAKDGIPLDATLQGVQSEFGVQVVDLREGRLCVVVSLYYTSIQGIKAGKDGDTVAPGKLSLAWNFPRPPVLVVEPRGRIVQVLLDKDFETPTLARQGYADAALSALGTFGYFPRLPDASEAEFPATLESVLFSFDYLLRARDEGASGDILLTGPLQSIRKLLLPPEAPIPVAGPERELIGRFQGRLSAKNGWYSSLQEDVDFDRAPKGTDKGTIRHRSTLTLQSHSVQPPTPGLDLDRDYAIFEPGEVLRRRLTAVTQNAAPAKKPEGESFARLHGLLSRVSGAETAQTKSSLREEARNAILEDPSILTRLDFLLQTGPPETARFLFEVLVNDPRLRALDGTDVAVLTIVGRSTDPVLLKEALVHFQQFPTDRVVDYLVHYRAAEPALSGQVAVSLSELAGRFAASGDAERTRRLLDLHLGRIERNEPGFTSSTSPLRQPGAAIDRYGLDLWEQATDKRAALRALSARAFQPADATGQFSRLVEKNLLPYSTEADLNALVRDLSWNAGLLRYVGEKAPYPATQTLARDILRTLPKD